MISISPVYLFTGPERGEKDRAISEIIDRYSVQSGSKPEIYKFYSFETSVSEIVSLLMNGGLFSEYKFVFLMNIDEIKKNEIPLLEKYLKNPAENSTLFLLTDSYKYDPRIAFLVKKENTRIFWELFDNQKTSWIQNYFNRKQKKITPEAIEMILELVENKTNDLALVCDRLLIHLSNTSLITEDEVEAFVSHSKEENVFTLFNYMIKNDFSGSLEVLHTIRLSGDNNPVPLLSGLLWQYRNLLNLKLLLCEGISEQKAFTQLKIRGKRKQSYYINASKLHSTAEVERIISLIAFYDRESREIGKERWLMLMELFIYYTIVGKGRHPEMYRR